MARDVVGRAVDAVGIARLGARIDRQCEEPIDGLHVDGLGLAHADLAEVEYGDLQADIEPAHQIALVDSLFQLIGVATVENIDEPAGLGETVGFREHIELDTRYLQIHAPGDRVHLDPRPCLNPTWHCRQRIGKLEVEICAGEAHGADERLAFACLALARGCQLRGQIGVEDLLARLIELVHRPGFSEARSQLGRGFGRRLRFRKEVNKLARGNGAIVGAPRFVGDTERLFGSAQLRLMEAFRGNLGARRQRR